MKHYLCALAGALAMTSAQADWYSVQFTGKVTKLEDTIGFSWEEPPAVASPVTAPTGTLLLGDTVSGSVTYDRSDIGGPPYYGLANELYYYPKAAVLQFAGTGLTAGGVSEGGVIWVGDNVGEAGVDYVLTWSYRFGFADGGKETVSLTLDDPTGTILSNKELPLGEITRFTSGRFYYEYLLYEQMQDGDWQPHKWSARGEITSLSLVSTVPEPGTYAMLLAGLGLVAWRRRAAR